MWAAYDNWLIPLLAAVAFLLVFFAAVYAGWVVLVELKKFRRAVHVRNVRDRSADIDWMLFKAFYARRAQELAVARLTALDNDNPGHSVRVPDTTLEVAL